MKIRIGTSADFCMSFQSTLDCIFSPKMVSKSFKMLIWSHYKNSVFVWKVLQKSRFGTFPLHEKSVLEVLRKNVIFLMVFGSRLTPIWAPKNDTICIKNRIENLIDFLWMLVLILLPCWESKGFHNRLK